MPALQVRDFPEDLYEDLKEYAKQQHRSMAQQTIQAVEEMLVRQSAQNKSRGPRIVRFESLRERDAIIAKRKVLFERIREYAKDLPDDAPSAVDFVREYRDELDRRDDEMITLLNGGAR